MDWDGDVKSKCPVVEHVDCEEQYCADAPFSEWYRRRFEKVATVWIELIVQCRETRENELEESDEQATIGLFP